MSPFEPPLNLPPSVDDAIDALTIELAERRHLAAAVMSTPVAGPRGQELTVAGARERAHALGDAIDKAEARDSLRHRRVSLLSRTLVIAMVAVVDFPIMLWLTSSVFNVDWTNPLGLPLMISVVLAVLATGGATAALYHLGRDQRQNKDHRRHLDADKLTIGSKISLLGVAVLVGLIATAAFYRVWTEGVYSGLDDLALLLAILIAVVMLISAWLVFWTAFRDGSLEQDDLAFYTRLVQRHLVVKIEHEKVAHQLEQRLASLARRTTQPVATPAPRNGHVPESNVTFMP